IALAYIVIAAQLVLALIESYIVLGGGVLFLGFAAFRGTAAFADNLIGYTFGVGVKVFLLYLIVGLGSQIAKSWIPLIQSSTFFGPTSPLLEVLGGALIFAILAVRVPHVVAHRLSGHATFGIAHALRALSWARHPSPPLHLCVPWALRGPGRRWAPPAGRRCPRHSLHRCPHRLYESARAPGAGPSHP